MFGTKPASLCYILNMCQSLFVFNFIVIWGTAAQSQTGARKNVMEKIPWSLKQQNVLFFFQKPKLNHHYILHSCIYLPFHAPCIFEDGWADHYEKH